MSSIKQHIEWLSLVPASGPFLSLETLNKVFPQGLPTHDSELMRSVRLAWEEWEEEGECPHPDPAIHTAWVRFVLSAILNFPAAAIAEGQGIPSGIKAEKSEYGVVVRPDYLIIPPIAASDELSLDWDEEETASVPEPESSVPLLLIQVYRRGQGLEKPVTRADIWNASPAARMQELLAQTGFPLGLITNGEDWMIVSRVTETVGFASFSAPIWQEEPLTLRAFRAILDADRFFGDPATTPHRLFADSADDHQEVTDQLGYQVRHAVEMLVQAIDEIDSTRSGKLLSEVPPAELYEGALTVMMRLVFLLCAEERGMFPLEEEVYSEFYAVSTLLGKQREAADAFGEEILERRCDAWSRLLALFRVIWGGVEHEKMRLMAYGGGLLDPFRFPWLDSTGDYPEPLPIHNRTVLHLLESLQTLQIKLPGMGGAETRRLSFRALDIEQIGHVYEGLLDHTAVRAAEPMLGLIGTKDREPEIALAELEAKAAKSRAELLKFLKEETGKSENALKNALDKPEYDASRLRVACDNDDALYERVKPFAGLIRTDEFRRVLVIPVGRVFVTTGTARRATGTHYTPRSLTMPIVARTLEPLIYRGMPLGVPPSRDSLKPSNEILALRVCDMACGSGAFLVEACRYLADRLCEAWEIAEQANPDVFLTVPDAEPATGSPTERIVPDKEHSPEERQILARRLVAAHCLYGVDKNPMAIDIAKLSLWLITMERGKAFHFLDHAIRCGDSLVGCTIEQIRTWSMNGAKKPNDKQIAFDLFSNNALDELRALWDELDATKSETADDMERKAALFQRIEAATERARLAGDLVIAPALMEGKTPAQAKLRDKLQGKFEDVDNNTDGDLRAEARAILDDIRPFHWAIEFFRIFDAGGFDAIVGNPPFMGGKKITGEMGVPYREYLVHHIGKGKKGSADIVAYFFLRAVGLLKETGSAFGLIATNTIAQGDTREVGLEQMIGDGATIYHALPSMKWPGKANLEVAVAHTYKGVWGTHATLSERDVHEISAFLDDGTASGKPFRLEENADRSFIGSVLSGIGFVMEPEQARALIAQNPKNAEVLQPYLNGEDLNSRPDQSPSRWVINFRNYPLGRIGQSLPVSGETMLDIAANMEINLSDDWRPKPGSRWYNAGQENREKWQRIGVVPEDYPDPVAADYPDCLRIVETLVKPDRDTLNRDQYRRLWWRFAERCANLYTTIADLPRVLATPIVTKYVAFVFVPAVWTFAHRLAVSAMADAENLAILQSTIFEIWARQYSSTLETRLNYSPSDCFETFPFPFADGSDIARASFDKGDNASGKGARATNPVPQATRNGDEVTAELPNAFADAPETTRGTPERIADTLETIGEAYHTHRAAVCMSRSLGLTKVYNLFHDRDCTNADIAELRRLHVEMDWAVAAAYGWHDLDLRHDFYGEGKETRYTLHPDARADVLRRLLVLNHERHAAQEAAAEDIFPSDHPPTPSFARRGRKRSPSPYEEEGRGRKRSPSLYEGEGRGGVGNPAQLTTDPILLEGIMDDLAAKSVSGSGAGAGSRESIEHAALLATYLVMRAEQPERLAGLRRHPARVRLSVPKSYTRLRLAKHLYFAQKMVRVPVTPLHFEQYQRGPYTRSIEDVEMTAQKRGYLTVSNIGDTGRDRYDYALGDNADKAVKEFLRLIDADELRLDSELIPLDEPKNVISEQWTTIHFAAERLKAQNGTAPTYEEIAAYVENWKPDRAAFANNALYYVHFEMKHRGLL